MFAVLFTFGPWSCYNFQICLIQGFGRNSLYSMLKKLCCVSKIHGQENEFCGKTLGNKSTSYALMLRKKNLEFVKEIF